MRQLVQSVRDGALRVIEFPTPTPEPTEILVATQRSLISAGTEGAVRALASASLLRKAKARPDLVRQVLDKARAEGLQSTVRAVRTKLDDDMPLGYSGMGIAVSVGDAVSGIRPGDRVATASAGHGDYQIVPGLLAAKVPDNVSDASSAFATVGAIALHGLRQAGLSVDASVAVIGLGLIGQLAVRLALASGLRVIGIDIRPDLVDRAKSSGAEAFTELGTATTRAVLELTQNLGVDAVMVTAATQSSEPVARATELLRDRGRIVVVGDVGLNLDRRTFYEKEIDLRFARSYGPGRYERSYEEYAIDFPVGYVRWTEGRNLQAVLSLLSRSRMSVDDLVDRTFELDEASEAYRCLRNDDSVLGVQFVYDAPQERAIVAPPPTTLLHGRLDAGQNVDTEVSGIGLIGAGLFTRSTFMPALREAGWPTPVAVASGSGLSAATLATKYGIESVRANADSLIRDERVSVVFVLSRHDSHAAIAESAMWAGKDVYVEKPLALCEEELVRLRVAQQQTGAILWSGFNRRYSVAVEETRRLLLQSGGPLLCTYRVNAGWLPDSHWYKDRRQGGRLLGEVCHFVDTVSWIVGQQPTRVVAFGDGKLECALQEDLTLALSYPDGSSASISYATGGSPRTPKERLEILGRAHTIVIDDYVSMSIDGKSHTIKRATKGHTANLRAFRAAVLGTMDATSEIAASLGTTSAMLAALRSLSEGGVQELL